MSSGSFGFSAFSGFSSLLLFTGLAASTGGVTLTCGLGVDGIGFGLLSFFAAFFFFNGSSMGIPQRSSRVSCTADEWLGWRGSISGFSSMGCACGFSTPLTGSITETGAITEGDTFSVFGAGCTSAAVLSSFVGCRLCFSYSFLSSCCSSIFRCSRKSSASCAMSPRCRSL